MPEQSDALVLSTQPYRETSLLVRLLTPRLGVVRGIAKGVRGARTTPAALYEPFSWIEVTIYQRKEHGLATLGAGSLKEAPGLWRRDLARGAYAALGFEVLGTLAEHFTGNIHYFAEGLRFLHLLDTHPAPGSLTLLLLLRLLHEAGYPPRLAPSLKGQALPPNLFYHVDNCLISDAKEHDDHAPAPDYRLSGKALTGLAPWLTEPPALRDCPVLGQSVGPELLRWLIHVWQDHLNQNLKSARYLEKMVLAHNA